GANLHQRPLDLKRDWCGCENACEVLNISRPDLIQEVHESFLAVGCDAVETNTFSGSQEDLEEAHLSDRAEEVNRTAAQIAGEACRSWCRLRSTRTTASRCSPDRMPGHLWRP